jgi:hypothetical protein
MRVKVKAWGFSLCSRVVTREISRTIMEYLFCRRCLSFLKSLVCDVITPVICPSITHEQHGFVGFVGTTVTILVEFSNFFLSEMENGRCGLYILLKAYFDRVNHELELVGTLTQKFRGPMIFLMGSYLTGRTQRVRIGDYLSTRFTVILVCVRVVILLLCFL